MNHMTRILSCAFAVLLPLAGQAADPAAPPVPTAAPAPGAAPAAPRPLVPLTTTKPNIPDAACQQRLNGWVDLEFAVMPDGKVADVRVTGSEPRGVFEAAAVASVSAWTFAPRPEPA